MDYEKEYKKLKAGISNAYLYAQTDSTKAVLENILHELAESEDEKVRKEIMDFIDTKTIDSDERRNRWFSYLEKYKPISFTSLDDTKVKISLIQYISELNQDVVHLHPGIETCNEWIAWLEKQGTSYTKRDVDDAFVEGMALAKDELEKQGEQKPTNKIEPKFKVGDWIVSNEKLYVYQIEEINKFVAKVRNINGETFVVNVNCLNDAHLWTIRDAKDGDVVSNGKMIVIFKHFEEPSYRQHIVAYIGLDTNGDIQITDDTWNLGIDKTKPATKEQRDTLIKAMTDAGYAFDFEKKELKKIEQNIEMVEALRTEYEKGRADAFAQTQKEWSDEDEKIVSEVIQNYESGFLPSVIERDRIVKTLKSLKDRVQPQPKQEWSEEDEKMFEYALDMIEWYSGKNENKSRAVSNWLKSLKDRVQPQNWTKEDKERYISCLKRLSTGNPEQPETINSKWFKEHVYPQTTWKPSDEQLEAVKRASNGSRAIAGNDYLIMESLYNNLKKLKGE